MPKCVAPNCSNRSSMKSQRQEEIEKHTKITFHRFPKEEERRLQWANALGFELTTLCKDAYMCSLHFPEESFDRTSVACVRLRDHAIPCVHEAGFSLSCSKQAVEPSTSANVLLTAKVNKVFAEKVVESSDETFLPHSNTTKRCLKSEEGCEVNVAKRLCVTAICNESIVQPTLSPEFQYVHISSLRESKLCRCCLSTKDLRSIVKPYLYRGTNEIYSDMLSMCFSKELSANDGWICLDCVGRLRATVSFRECVESAKNYLNSLEKNIQDHKYSQNDDYVDDGDDRPFEIKEEVVDLVDIKPSIHEPAVSKQPATVLVPPAPPEASSKLPSGTDSSSDEDFFEEYFKPCNATKSEEVFNKLEFDVSESSTLPYVLDSTDRTCEICRKEFTFFGQLVNHMPEHYPNHICEICGKICATRKSFELHIITHTGVRHPCEKCDKSFINKDNLNRHVKAIHKGIKALFKCNMCGEALTTHGRRVNHMVEEHGREKHAYKCKQCPRKYTLSSHLSVHIRRAHLQERNHKCEECGSSFFTRKCLEQHSVKHTGVRNFACDSCTKTYKTKYGLTVHTKKSHKKMN